MQSIGRLAAVGGMASVVVVFWWLLPDTFLTVNNLLNVSRQVSMLAVVAVTMTVVMAMGDFGLSVGSTASLAGVVAAVGFQNELGVPAALALALSVGLLCGLLNGVLVSLVGVLPFVATLGTLTIYGGLAFIVADGKTIFGRDIPQVFGDFARGGIHIESIDITLPALTLVAGAIALLVWVSLERLVLGRHLYVIGGNEQAARLAGIRVRRLRLLAFGITGVGAAEAGLMLASRVASANPIQGSGLMLDAIAAVFLGMTLVRSGEPHVLPTLAGVALLGIVDNGLTQLSVDSYVREMLVGAIVILAVALSGTHRSARVRSI